MSVVPLKSQSRRQSHAYGVYSVQTPAKHGVDGEERQGKLLATLAAEANVSHFVYSSVGGAERNSGIPHFESKCRIEQHIHSLGLRATVLRPSVFMDNFGPVAFRTVMLSMMRLFMPEDRAVQMIATRDIGVFAARAFENPDSHIGQSIELAGDLLTRAQAAGVLRKAGQRPAVTVRLPGLLRAKLPEEFRSMFAWFGHAGFVANISALRAEHPGLLTLEQWAASRDAGRQHARVMENPAPTSP